MGTEGTIFIQAAYIETEAPSHAQVGMGRSTDEGYLGRRVSVATQASTLLLGAQEASMNRVKWATNIEE